MSESHPENVQPLPDRLPTSPQQAHGYALGLLRHPSTVSYDQGEYARFISDELTGSDIQALDELMQFDILSFDEKILQEYLEDGVLADVMQRILKTRDHAKDLRDERKALLALLDLRGGVVVLSKRGDMGSNLDDDKWQEILDRLPSE